MHPDCEVYINLSGNVSFMVENRIYPIISGSVIVTRPYEYHHCIYHDDSPHKHFCIWFSVEQNPHFLKRFYDRKSGEENLLLPDVRDQRELISLCYEWLEDEGDPLQQQHRFLRLLGLLEHATVASPPSECYPPDLTAALDEINRSFSQPISLAALAAASYVSVSTLERHFAQWLHMTPSDYLRKRRLSHAAELLAGGSSVMEACLQSGFSDNSRFIALFKRYYGMTPLNYKKQTGGRWLAASGKDHK